MIFEWDDGKNRSNLAKHGISFATASLAFQDPNLLSFVDRRFDDEEERWVSIGMLPNLTIIILAHTIRGEGDEETCRIISARKANQAETERYFGHT